MSAPLLISACDAGSGNFLAPVLPRLKRAFALYAQTPASKAFDRWKIPYQAVDRHDQADLLALGTGILSQNKPKLVITGTSWGPTLDKALTLAARTMQIPCVAIVEHWDLYLERFSTVTDGRITDPGRFLPDRIWVNDETARTEATTAGLPADQIDTVGQPHLEWHLGQLGTKSDRVLGNKIMFVSEQVGQDFAKESPLYRGFDEFETLAGILTALESSDWQLIVKLHPQESIDKYDRILGNSRRVLVVKDADNAELIRSCGRIIGMFSMLLIEAALIRDDVISFMPGGNPDVFIGNRVGATTCITDPDTLRTVLATTPRQPAQEPIAVSAFGKRFLGSTARVCETIENLLQ